MKTEVKEVYKCDFCKKLYQIKPACIKHESGCSKNPDNQRPCFMCPNLINKDAAIYIDQYDGSQHERNIRLLFCEAKKVFIYPPKVEVKKNMYELDEENEPMPKMCEIYNNLKPEDYFNF